MSNIVEFTKEEKQIIKTQFFPRNATNEDMQYCMGVAKSLGLNPITKEIWFIERKANINGQWVTKIEPMAGRDSYIKVAHRSGDFGGIESHAELKDIPSLNHGNWETKKDLVAVAKVYKKGIEKPFVAEVNYSEYVQKTKAGQPTKFWAEKPHTMLKKVAESQALRKAFNITGVYDEAEIREDNSDIETVEIVETKVTIEDLKRTLSSKLLKEYGLSKAMIKEFADHFELNNNEDLIESLIDDAAKMSEYVSKFDKGEK